MRRKLLTTPGGSLRAIFQNNAHLGQTVTRCIRRRPVFRLTRFQTRFNQCFNFRHLAVVRLRAALQEHIRLLLQQAEHGRELTQMRRQRIGRRHIF